MNAPNDHTSQVAATQAELRFRDVADHAPIMMWVTDPDGQCLYLNRRWYEFTGQTPDEAEGIGWLDATHPDDKAEAERTFLAANARRAPFRLEYRLRRADGAYRWAIDAASPQFSEQGEYLGYVGSVIDIQERHEAEERLSLSEERLRLAIEAADVSFWDVDVVNSRLFWPPAVKAMFGISADEPVTMDDFYSGLHPEDRDRTAEAFSAACDPVRRALYDVEYRTIGKQDGRLRWVAAKGRAIFDGDKCLRVNGTAIDITAQRQTQAALRASEERYQSLFGAIDAGFCVVEVDLNAPGGRIDYRVVEANPAFYTQTGLSPEILGVWLRKAVPGLEEHWFETYGKVARTGEPARFESGSNHLGRWFDVYAFPVGEADTRRVAILFNDISARRRAEERLQASLQQMPSFVSVLTGPDHVFEYVNDAYVALAGPRDFIGRNVREVFPELEGQGFFELLDQVYTTGEPFTARAIPLRLAGEGPERYIDLLYGPIHDDGVVSGIFAGGYDVTERIRAEAALQQMNAGLEQAISERTADLSAALAALRAEVADRERVEEALRQSQKLESMGQLTGGVAHDFNNLLTPIIGALDMLERGGLGSEREQRWISGALESAERAKTLVQRLLAFARRQPLQPRAVDVGKLIGNMAELIASTTGPQIRVSVEAPADLPPAFADANQVEMAILNLAVNARDAMPNGGTLRISASPVSVRDGEEPQLRSGDYIQLSVADTGTGMDETTMARAVEPFFSTKGVGKGTGLGLSMVHGLASQLGGALRIQSRKGVGTNIQLWLPVSRTPADVGGADNALAPAHPRAGTALLVEDEELVRMATSEMLTELGYAVMEASSAEQAIEMVRGGLSPNLLVTDHLMPGMNGADLARTLLSELPEVQVLIVSGYAEAEGIAPDIPRMTKPFRVEDLAASLAAGRG